MTANLPTVDEQIERIAEAEDEKSSAFSVSQEDTDAVLVTNGTYENSKYRIYRQFQKNEGSKNNIAVLKKEYGIGGGGFTFSDGVKGHINYDSKGISIDRKDSDAEQRFVLKWSQVEKRLRELIKDNRYLNPKEKDHYSLLLRYHCRYSLLCCPQNLPLFSLLLFLFESISWSFPP